MSELLNDIRAEIKEALDKRKDDLYRELSRTAIINTDGVDLEIIQYKFLSDTEIDHVRANGLTRLANKEWFNNVEWMQQLPNDDSRTWDQLRLDAMYPMEFFAEKPTTGTFDGDGRWLDQYGGISGFGSSHDAINTWSLSFVDTDSHAVQRLSYPSDPTAIDTYNARYRQYLGQLDSADVTISHYRAWDHPLSRDKERTPRTIGGLLLVGIGVNEVLRQGESSADSKVDSTRILLYTEGKKQKYVGRDVTIIGDEVITEPFWDGEKDRKPASKKLLTTTLKLIQDANKIK